MTKYMPRAPTVIFSMLGWRRDASWRRVPCVDHLSVAPSRVIIGTSASFGEIPGPNMHYKRVCMILGSWVGRIASNPPPVVRFPSSSKANSIYHAQDRSDRSTSEPLRAERKCSKYSSTYVGAKKNALRVALREPELETSEKERISRWS